MLALLKDRSVLEREPTINKRDVEMLALRLALRDARRTRHR